MVATDARKVIEVYNCNGSDDTVTKDALDGIAADDSSGCTDLVTTVDK